MDKKSSLGMPPGYENTAYITDHARHFSTATTIPQNGGSTAESTKHNKTSPQSNNTSTTTKAKAHSIQGETTYAQWLNKVCCFDEQSHRITLQVATQPTVQEPEERTRSAMGAPQGQHQPYARPASHMGKRQSNVCVFCTFSRYDITVRAISTRSIRILYDGRTESRYATKWSQTILTTNCYVVLLLSLIISFV
jgi:hypothetical protein